MEVHEICKPEDYMEGNCILTYQTDGKNDKLTIEEQNKIKNSILNQLDYVFTSEQYYNTYLNGLDSTDDERNFGNMKISFSSLETKALINILSLVPIPLTDLLILLA